MTAKTTGDKIQLSTLFDLYENLDTDYIGRWCRYKPEDDGIQSLIETSTHHVRHYCTEQKNNKAFLVPKVESLT